MGHRLPDLLILAALTAACPGALAGQDPKLEPDELVARHLESIGPLEAREGRTSSVAEGRAGVSLLIGGAGRIDGAATFICDRGRLSLLMDFGRPEYLHEHFIYDGRRGDTAFMQPGIRSPLGDFLYTYSDILKEGLFGGVLSARWPLLDTPGRKPRLRNRGLERFDDERLYELEYRMRRGGGDLRIRLYFDPSTFRHVSTTYDVSISPNLGATPAQSSRLRTTRLRLVERFGDFRSEGSLTLPMLWELEFSREGTVQGVLWKWRMEYERISHNRELDDSSFTLR